MPEAAAWARTLGGETPVAYRQWDIAFEETSSAQRQGLDYWRRLPEVGDSTMPAVADFDLLEVPASILPTTHVIDVLDGGEDFRFRFWGSGFRNFLGYDGTGMSTRDLMPEDIRDPVRAAYRHVMEARRPIAMLSEFERTGSYRQQGFQRFIRMPLAAPDGSVGRIVSLVEFLMDYHAAQKLIAEVANNA